MIRVLLVTTLPSNCTCNPYYRLSHDTGQPFQVCWTLSDCSWRACRWRYRMRGKHTATTATTATNNLSHCALDGEMMILNEWHSLWSLPCCSCIVDYSLMLVSWMSACTKCKTCKLIPGSAFVCMCEIWLSLWKSSLIPNCVSALLADHLIYTHCVGAAGSVGAAEVPWTMVACSRFNRRWVPILVLNRNFFNYQGALQAPTLYLWRITWNNYLVNLFIMH